MENKTFRPKLGRSCRCMKIQGHGYEPVVTCVLICLKFVTVHVKRIPYEIKGECSTELGAIYQEVFFFQ